MRGEWGVGGGAKGEERTSNGDGQREAHVLCVVCVCVCMCIQFTRDDVIMVNEIQFLYNFYIYFAYKSFLNSFTCVNIQISITRLY